MRIHLHHALAGLATLATLATAAGANATAVVVDAKTNSTYLDSGVFTGVNLTAGETLKVHVDAGDIWSAGTLPRWSNANGLVGDLYATGTDESGLAAGTLIGQALGPVKEDNFFAPYAALVGKIGATYKILGTDFDGLAWGTGELRLYFWDTPGVTYDNKDYITAEITHGWPVEVDVPTGGGVPEPATWAMMIMGFGLTGATLRRGSPRVGVAAA
jgi:hypothetical protein